MKKWISVMAVSMGCVALTSQAAVITWGSASDVAAYTDVRTDGFLVEGFNLGGTTSESDRRVKVVPFTGDSDFLDGDSDIDFFTNATGNATYDALLSACDLGNGTAGLTNQVGNGNLEVGNRYLIQLWYVDDRSGTNVMRFGDGNGNTVDLNSNPGQHVAGAFTADSTSQDLTLDAVTTISNAHCTAYQIRDISEGYQSDFTGADLASAGLVKSAGAAGGSWTLNTVNDRVDGVGGGNARSSLSTIESWQNDLGFTLEITFQNTAAMTRFSCGIVDANYAIPGASDCFNSAASGAYGIGFVTAGEMAGTTYTNVSGIGAGDVLVFNDGSGSGGDRGGEIKLSIDQGDITYGAWQKLFITVTSNSWSYSLNGQPPTTGTWATPFDTSRSYRFTAYAQSNNQALFSSIKLRARTESYQSDFTGADLGSAGLATSPGTLGYWLLDTVNDRVKGTGGSNSRANLYSLGSWQYDTGFALDVTFQAEGAIVYYSFGIVDATYDIAAQDNNTLDLGYAGAYGMGFVAAAYLAGAGAVSGIGAGDCLAFNDGSGSGGDKGGSIKLSIGQGDMGTGPQTMSITVTADSWRYSLNGQPATKGTWATPFDLSRSYRFVAQAQRVHDQKYFTNISLSQYIPPPAGSVFIVR